MQSRISVLVVAAVLAATLAIFPGSHATQSIVANDAQKVAAPAKQHDAAPSLDTTRVVPADVLGTGVVSWAPLTGDGSN